MTIADKAVLVTRANRGIGRALVEEALRRPLWRDPGRPAVADPFAGSDRQRAVGYRLPADSGVFDLQGGRLQPDTIAARPARRTGLAAAYRAHSTITQRANELLAR
jgi:hypothetical protein